MATLQVKRLNALFQQFAQMLRDRRGEEPDQWLTATFHSDIPELRAFVKKLHQDQQAVQAGFILKWNNGMVEGHVNRLKFLKRSRYGRANLVCFGYGSCIIESVHKPIPESILVGIRRKNKEKQSINTTVYLWRK